ncbi:MAG: hypothetical protein JWM02_3128, partial [Frankiales bacterium]|nr:hypothetical protein [Frankiales bacterium]
MRRLITSLVVLLLLLVVADRVGVVAASRVVASKLETSAGLTSAPSVRIRGFPFLTQAVGGRYDEIDVTVTNLVRFGVRLSRLDASMHGVRLPLSQALSGRVSNVPVEGITATAVITYAEVASRGNIAGMSVVPSGTGVRVTARLTVLGQSVTADAESTVRLSGGFIVVTARKVSVLGQS